MSPGTYSDFCAHAAAEHPKEACGALVTAAGRDRYVPCRNVADCPEETFALEPADYLRASETGEILAVCHSHPDGPATPSQADRSACEASGLPWYILSWPAAELYRIEPVGYEAPLIGRPFVHGVHDCYSLVRDYYRRELAIELPDFPRAELWWEKGYNLYAENFKKAGFCTVEDLQKHDVILMQVQASVTNHAAVHLGDSIILHHLYGRLSGRTVYGGYWAKHTTHILRHRGRA